jgi:hypothetical protein
MKDNGSPSCASRHGGNGSRPASTYKGMWDIGNALALIRRTAGTHMLLAIAAGRQVELGWGDSSARLVGKSGFETAGDCDGWTCCSSGSGLAVESAISSA